MNSVTPSRRDRAGTSGRRHARLTARAASPPVPRRARLRAARAFALLATIIVGVPAMLVLLVGPPIPMAWAPAWAPARTVDPASLLAIMADVVWLAWVHFVICVIAEWWSGRRGSALPLRIPLGGSSQTLAHRLVAATLLFSGTAILLTPGTNEPRPRPAITASAVRPLADDAASLGSSRGSPGVSPGGATGAAAGESQSEGSGTAVAANVDTGVMAAAGVITPLRGIAGSALLAAGVVVALAERRPRRNADDAVDDFETMLRLAADVGAARFVDQALRVLSAELTKAGRALPPVYAAALSDSALLLHIAPAEPEGPPPPWRVGEIPGHWLIDRLADTPDGLPAGVVAGIPASTPAPYPGLATVGTDGHGAQILVDIEGAPGIISLVGDAAVAREAVVSIAVELATNLWSDDLRVYMIGFPELTAPIVPDRLRTSSSLDEVLSELSDRGSRHGGAAGGTRDPAGSGREHNGHGNDVNSTFDAALRGRQAARTQALWAPDLLVLPEPPSGDDVARLSVLATGRTQGIGVITVGDTAATRWRFTVDAERRLSLGVLGLDVNALTLSAPEYAAILEMFSQPDAGSTSWNTPGPEPRALPAALPSAEMVRSVDGGSAAATSAPGPELTPAPAPVPWVPEIPRWMRPLGSGPQTPSPGAPDSHRHAPIPAIPPIPPPPPPATTPPPTPPPRPPSPPGERAMVLNPPYSLDTGAGGEEAASGTTPGSAGSRTIPATGLPALPPPRSFPVQAVPAQSAGTPQNALAQVSMWEAVARRPPPVLPPGEKRPDDTPIQAPHPTSPTPPTRRPQSQRPHLLPPGELPGIPEQSGEEEPPRRKTHDHTALGASIEPPALRPHQENNDQKTFDPGREARTGGASGNDTLPRSGPPASPPSPLPDLSTPASAALVLRPGTPLFVTVDLYRPSEAEIRVLGTVTVDAPGPLEADRRDLLTELVIYLALHRDGTAIHDLSTTLWPHGVPDDVVMAALDHARAWLGPGSGGSPRITASADGSWRLADDLRCDWDLFVAYARRSKQPDADAEENLSNALRLVTGPLWTNLPDQRYRWLTSSTIRTATTTAVVDVAHRLAMLTLGYGDTLTAVAACRTGLRAVPTAEVLWQDLLRTVAARHDRKALEAVISEMHRVITPPRSGLKIQAETGALIRELLSGLRHR
ncbi:bacterial transcriptional activator domain-containing protein [Frankia sp. CiP3]|uniref:AfsR/SARP family transcriptional regulator n=1 Tax=Frankia sp. CiP3 TaxID=2880971 RepID=UPI001EF5F7C8|nr:bacterial transcriptional activator domain-containing protein [Frankia sp. CiP3]